MEHIFSGFIKHSPLGRIDARVKTIVALGFVVITATMQSHLALLAALLLMVAVAVVARLSVRVFFKRLAWLIPFAGVMVVVFPFVIPGTPLGQMDAGLFTLTATAEGLEKAILLLLRVLNGVLALTVLTTTTKFKDLLEALNHLKVPTIFTQLMEFTVRYFFVLGDEYKRMQTARKARGFEAGSVFSRKTYQALGELVAVLFMRSYERGDRVFLAMLARGYGGHNHCCGHCRIQRADLYWGAAVMVLPVGLKILELGGYLWPISLK
ncbi:MAG: cobalt ECF transporter T component CbiQ [Clostridia bacterium]|nr:cobalt ECF transporter T component CbiQ [Clostridia bacterium]